MKKILLIIIIFTVSGKFSYAQNLDTTSLNFNEDSILNKIIAFIPKGWIASGKNGELVTQVSGINSHY